MTGSSDVDDPRSDFSFKYAVNLCPPAYPSPCVGGNPKLSGK